MKVWFAFNLSDPFQFCGTYGSQIYYHIVDIYYRGSHRASKHLKAGSQWDGHIVKVVIFFSIIARRNC